jgi:hypothetical protein
MVQPLRWVKLSSMQWFQSSSKTAVQICSTPNHCTLRYWKNALNKSLNNALVLQLKLSFWSSFFWYPTVMWIHLQEDNKVNQMVAVRLLNTLGCTVTVACNGIEALSILECPSTYDIIFMDCHMPVILTENALLSLLFLPKTPYRIFYPFNSLQNAQVWNWCFLKNVQSSSKFSTCKTL